MPKLTKMFHLDLNGIYLRSEVTPQQFLDACSPVELRELELMLSSRKYQVKINQGSITMGHCRCINWKPGYCCLKKESERKLNDSMPG